MATSTSLPAKYLPALTYFAAMIIAEQEEQFETKSYMEREAYKRLLSANAVEDYLPNNERSIEMGYCG